MKPCPDCNLKSVLIEAVLILAIISFSWWLMSSTFGYRDGKMLIDTKLWSDFGAHIPLIRSFSKGSNLPPEYPQFANRPIKYHYLFYLLVGGLERLGLNIALSLNIVSALGFGLLLWMIYLVGKLVGKSKKVGLLSLILFLFNGSLTYATYFNEHGFNQQALADIFKLRSFVNFGPWNGDLISAFWNWNIFTNQRHLGLSFGLILVLIWLLLKEVFARKDKVELNLRWLFLIWFGLILLPFLHLAGYLIVLIFIVGWLALNPNLIKKFGLVYGLGLLYSLPGLVYFVSATGNSGFDIKVGFLAQQKTFLGILKYWWFNIGLYLPLILVTTLFLKRNKKKLLIVFYLFFMLANSFRFSKDMINNHKLVNFFLIGLSILSANLLVKLWQMKIWAKILVILIFPLLTLSGLLDIFPIVNDGTMTVVDLPEDKAAFWIEQNTPVDSVFVVTKHFYHPALLAGRKTYMDYGYFAWSLGYEEVSKKWTKKRIFSQDISLPQWCRLVARENIDYISLDSKDAEFKDVQIENSWLVKNRAPIFHQQSSTTRIYSVEQVCN